MHSLTYIHNNLYTLQAGTTTRQQKTITWNSRLDDKAPHQVLTFTEVCTCSIFSLHLYIIICLLKVVVTVDAEHLGTCGFFSERVVRDIRMCVGLDGKSEGEWKFKDLRNVSVNILVQGNQIEKSETEQKRKKNASKDNEDRAVPKKRIKTKVEGVSTKKEEKEGEEEDEKGKKSKMSNNNERQKSQNRAKKK